MWWTVLLWLLRTLGPIILEWLVKWIIDHIPHGEGALTYQSAMAALPGDLVIPPRQYQRALKLVQKNPTKWPQILAAIEREKSKLKLR